MSFLRRLRMIRICFYLGVVACGFFNKELKTWFSPAPAGAKQEKLPAPAEMPAPATAEVSPAAPAPPAGPAWTPPTLIPPVPGGTLTTPTAIYTNARIVKVEADRVTIMSDAGRTVIPTWQLPSGLQQELNYDPQAALAHPSR